MTDKTVYVCPVCGRIAEGGSTYAPGGHCEHDGILYGWVKVFPIDK